ncbi:Hypothetical protein Trvi_ORF111 [Trabala vishnou gigantina nucleopolyhedrovirus]|uniref:Hypothetical protein n=1 Tax=Trabala vishnou gigantina nucleopolyhedrovirus TaxID=2863583 RepID=UPI0024819BF9|nr:Hypothetical protein QKU87_gp111 [Trabala vishnou gigantina nucleopolyhedrovirus]QYC92736.1 Hypothetical protein Trvi_ORF111 [Trabala vishnou gigantina nucleopolyhedrovirus]
MIYDKFKWDKHTLDELRVKNGVSKLFFHIDGHYVVLEHAELVNCIEKLPANSKTFKYLKHCVYKQNVWLANWKHKTLQKKRQHILFTRLTFANLLLLACNEFLHEIVVAMLNYKRTVLSKYKKYKNMQVKFNIIKIPISSKIRFELFCKRTYPFCDNEQQRLCVEEACTRAGIDANRITKKDLIPFANKIAIWWLHHMYKPGGKQMIVAQYRFTEMYTKM